jgi:EpsG family
MIYWIVLYVCVLSMAGLYQYENCSRNLKILIFVTILFQLIYFSAFRDGLGQDYDGYADVVKSGIREFSISEPGYTLIADWVYKEKLSIIVFFLFFSIITVTPQILVYRTSRDFFISVIVFVSLPILYFNSFNIVRQYAAASILLCVLQWPMSQNKLKYIIAILLASSFHVSALFAAPFYLLLDFKFSKKPIILFIVICFLLNELVISNVISLPNLIPDVYFHYSEDESKSEGGNTLTYIFIFLLSYLISVRESLILNRLENKLFNMFVLCVGIYLLIPSFFYMYRFAIYFIVAIPMVVALPVKHDKSGIYRFTIAIISIIIFVYFLESSLGNDKVLPVGIKSFLDLYYE